MGVGITLDLSTISVVLIGMRLSFKPFQDYLLTQILVLAEETKCKNLGSEIL